MTDDVLTYILAGLARSKGRWPEVAKGSGVPYRTIEKIVQHPDPNPTVRTALKLARYFEREGIAD